MCWGGGPERTRRGRGLDGVDGWGWHQGEATREAGGRQAHVLGGGTSAHAGCGREKWYDHVCRQVAAVESFILSASSLRPPPHTHRHALRCMRRCVGTCRVNLPVCPFSTRRHFHPLCTQMAPPPTHTRPHTHAWGMMHTTHILQALHVPRRHRPPVPHPCTWPGPCRTPRRTWTWWLAVEAGGGGGEKRDSCKHGSRQQQQAAAGASVTSD